MELLPATLKFLVMILIVQMPLVQQSLMGGFSRAIKMTGLQVLIRELLKIINWSVVMKV
jgi:hypothetical protein